MFSDHVGILFFPGDDIYRIIGRISFPLFAFLVAEGFVKTSNEKKYLSRLFIFGIIAQIPFMYFKFLSGYQLEKLNILFTLSGGLLLLILIKRKLYFKIFLVSLLLIIIEGSISFDYGFYGILLILFSYVFIKNKVLGLFLLLFITSASSINMDSIADSSLQVYALLSILPVMFYNGEIGKKVSRWWFYAIYPIHFLILALIFHLLL